MHSSLEATDNNSGESLLGAMIWQLFERGVFNEVALETDPDRNIAIVEGRSDVDEDVVGGGDTLTRRVEILFREPYELPPFSASQF